MRIFSVLFAAALALAAPASAADAGKAGARVLIIPFDGDKGGFKEYDAALTAAAVDAVKSSGKFTYVGPDKFAENWVGKITPEERKLFKGDPAEEMKDLKRYRRAFVHEDLGTIAEYRDRWGVDLVIIGRVVEAGTEAGSEPRLVSEIISTATGRLYGVDKVFEPDKAGGIMKKEVLALLAKSDEVLKVDADGVVNPSRSIIGYDLKADGGRYLRAVFDYSSDRPNPALQKIEIVPHRPIKDGILKLVVVSLEKKPITFQYFYKNGQFVNIKISADPPEPAASGKTDEESLTVRSVGGYIIKFTFQWKDGKISGIRAEPAVNPYGEVR